MVETLFESESIKTALTETGILELIRKRWSARSFSPQQITKQELDTILESASWAFSAMNYQPWRYFYAQKKDEAAFSKILDTLAASNAAWAKNASHLLVSVVKKKYDNGTVNASALHDVGAANATLVLQAQSMNIYSHLMGGFDKEKLASVLSLDREEFEPVVVIAMGYLDSPDKLEEPFRSREITKRKRNSPETYAFQFEV